MRKYQIKIDNGVPGVGGEMAAGKRKLLAISDPSPPDFLFLCIQSRLTARSGGTYEPGEVAD